MISSNNMHYIGAGIFAIGVSILGIGHEIQHFFGGPHQGHSTIDYMVQFIPGIVCMFLGLGIMLYAKKLR